jgi:hypothetical protein
MSVSRNRMEFSISRECCVNSSTLASLNGLRSRVTALGMIASVGVRFLHVSGTTLLRSPIHLRHTNSSGLVSSGLNVCRWGLSPDRNSAGSNSSPAVKVPPTTFELPKIRRHASTTRGAETA